MHPEARRTRVLFVVLLAVACTLVTLDYQAGRGSPLDGLRTAVGSVFGPVQGGLSGIARAVGTTIDGLTGSTGSVAQVRALERANATLREELTAVRAAADPAALGRLRSTATGAGLRIVPARVITIGGAFGYPWTVGIDAGSRQGVATGLPVMDSDGLVGRVIAVTPSTATVLLMADPASKVGVRVVGTGQIGLVSGRGPGWLGLELLDTNARLRVGDQLVSFGSPDGRPYVGGLPVGRVSAVLGAPGTATRTALVTPDVRFTALDLLGVVVAAPQAATPAPARTPPPAAVVPAPGVPAVSGG